MFLWRAIRDILLTACNLQKRAMLETPVCPFCGVEPETPIHTFLRCTFAQQVWALSNLRWQDLNTADLSFESWCLGLSSVAAQTFIWQWFAGPFGGP
ncbi:UNVERIFIED_CONTAM: hypothetical protein Slati_0103800 [Sesamum latifolium]|uniref:Reverse transcriptase zinc-binding domain-containing protein n=1 Tax=Sesamum latifolium TaxID=2727402 RepID=A0AAW2Y8R6_9LAMI